jgi:hypothetical protein
VSNSGSSGRPALGGFFHGAAGPIVATLVAVLLGGGGYLVWQGVGDTDDPASSEETEVAPVPTASATVSPASESTLTPTPGGATSNTRTPEETPTEPTLPQGTFLATIDPLERLPYGHIEAVRVDGEEVTRSVVQRLGCARSALRGAWNLAGQGYELFTARAGLDDNFPTSARARFTVMADNEEILDEVVLSNYEHKEFSVPIKDRNRLILEMELLEGNPRCVTTANGVWGNAALR